MKYYINTPNKIIIKLFGNCKKIKPYYKHDTNYYIGPLTLSDVIMGKIVLGKNSDAWDKFDKINTTKFEW